LAFDVQRLAEGIERITGEAHARARLERLLGIAGVRVSVWSLGDLK